MNPLSNLLVLKENLTQAMKWWHIKSPFLWWEYTIEEKQAYISDILCCPEVQKISTWRYPHIIKYDSGIMSLCLIAENVKGLAIDLWLIIASNIQDWKIESVGDLARHLLHTESKYLLAVDHLQ